MISYCAGDFLPLHPKKYGKKKREKKREEPHGSSFSQN